MRTTKSLTLCVLLLSVVLPPIPSHAIRSESRVPQLFREGLAFHASLEPTVCQSESCQSKGRELKASLDESVDPCGDFYEFACGGWISGQELRNDWDSTSISKEADQLIDEKMEASLSREVSKDDSVTVAYLKDYYRSCTDNDTRHSVGLTPIRSFMKSVGGWPLLGDHFDEEAFDWRKVVAKLLAMGVTTAFKVEPLHLFSKQTYKLDTFFDLVQNDLVSHEDPDDNLRLIEKYREDFLHTVLMYGGTNDTNTRKQIDEVVDFQLEATKAWRTGSYETDFLTLDKLGEWSNHTIDWVQFFNDFYTELNSTIRVSKDLEVMLGDNGYYQTVPPVLSRTAKRVIANYLGFIVGQHFDEYLLRNNPNDDQSFKCTVLVSRASLTGLSRLFIDSVFNANDETVAIQMVNDIKGSFDDIIRATDWLDKNTSEAALTKLRDVKENIGYPHWYRDNKLLDEANRFTQKADPKNFLANIIYLDRRTAELGFNFVTDSLNFTDDGWDYAPYTVNAFYKPWENRITIPAAELSPPFFDSSLPTAINYGSGSVIGHELTHGFDTTGSEYDEFGEKRNWWTDSVRKYYNSKADCFRREYSAIVEPKTGLHLNGNKTIGEDIADNGGIQEAYRAYQKSVQRLTKLERLPVIDKYSADQQFFISYAHSWCTKAGNESIKSSIEIDEHSLAKYRVNIPLQNFETFSQVFKCGVNSAMNRRDKCVLW